MSGENCLKYNCLGEFHHGPNLPLDTSLPPRKMAKRTKKVGIVRKYGTRYGARLRKTIKKMDVIQHGKYICSFCGKKSMRRIAAGIWGCKSCCKCVAGGAYIYSTTAAAGVRSQVRRLCEMKENYMLLRNATKRKKRIEKVKTKHLALDTLTSEEAVINSLDSNLCLYILKLHTQIHTQIYV